MGDETAREANGAVKRLQAELAREKQRRTTAEKKLLALKTLLERLEGQIRLARVSVG